jgi:hypothetical protein
MKYVIWLLVIALVIAHQDNWNWDDNRLVLGFLPVGLAYHVGISLAAGLVWMLACFFAWPKELTETSERPNSEGGQPS